ncbi:hypothetical protein KY289_006337 [Solanum tuberosum]|nr:hypothetical protein KY289_006337 [Solanum tuberosum]
MEFLSIFVEKVTGCLMQPERAEVAQRNLKRISRNGEAWLTSVDTTIEHVEAVSQGSAEVERGCFYGWCPNLKSRYSMSRRAEKITLELIELQNESNRPDVISFDHPVQSEAIPSNYGEVFDSRKLKEDEVMAALKDDGVTMIGICGLGGVDQLRTRLMDQNSRTLVILDDVWEALHDLHKLGIPSGSNHNYRCKVILTTRLRPVCEEMEAQKIMEVGTLPEEEAWILFKEKVGNSVDDLSLLDIAKDVSKECKGLPLAIIIVTGALKQEDSDILIEELLKYGMGLRIFSGIENLEDARNRVYLLLEILKDGFLLSQGSDKSHVKMHDVVRDVAISIASEGEHNFKVSHHVNSKEFPRKDSYEQYSHMSIVANKFDELPSPIVCPKLKFLMLKLCFGKPLKLHDDFFYGMSNLNVISLNSILCLPASIRRLSSLRTLCLSNIRLGDISIIGELVTLEILNIRGCQLEEVPVEIGKLTNLIMLELRNERLKMISAGVLSRLVRLEELHMVGVKHCSYSILSEVESLSRLTTLTLSECSEDVIYIPSNLDLSSKFARYTLTVDEGPYTSGPFIDDYDKNIVLVVTKTTPLEREMSPTL